MGGTVFVDQSYWQSAVAAKPRSAVIGFLIGGMVWFAVPFCMATTNGLAGRALTTHPDIEGAFGAYYIDGAASSSGLTPARVLSKVLGPAGAFILLLQLFMAITSTGSAEIIAVSSILTYDIYYEYINPELKMLHRSIRSLHGFLGSLPAHHWSQPWPRLHVHGLSCGFCCWPSSFNNSHGNRKQQSDRCWSCWWLFPCNGWMGWSGSD